MKTPIFKIRAPTQCFVRVELLKINKKSRRFLVAKIVQDEIFDPLGMSTAAWGCSNNDPDILPEFQYKTVIPAPAGKPWAVVQRNPTPVPHEPHFRTDEIAEKIAAALGLSAESCA